jgi:hypothetical protein
MKASPPAHASEPIGEVVQQCIERRGPLDEAYSRRLWPSVLAKLKGALDPGQKPVGDRKKAIDTLMLSIIKNTDGPSLLKDMRAAGVIVTDV